MEARVSLLRGTLETDTAQVLTADATDAMDGSPPRSGWHPWRVRSTGGEVVGLQLPPRSLATGAFPA
jgi:hypothetical protein